MAEQSSDAPRPTSALSQLGAGGRADRLDFRLIVALLWRCVRLLHPVRWHIASLIGGFTALAILLLPVMLFLFDVFWTRALQGQPLTEVSARLLGFDPAQSVHVAQLEPELRRALARRAVWVGLGISCAMLPAALALWYYQVWILQRVNQLLRVEILERLQSLSLRFHAESRVGDAIYRLYQDSAMVTQLVEVLFLTPLFSLGRFAMTLVAIGLYDPWLALIIAGLWPPALLLGAWFSRRLRVGFRAAREANSDLTSHIQETLAGIRVLKAYGAEAREQQRFETSSREAFARAREARSLLAAFGIGVFWLSGLALLAVTALSTLATRSGDPLFAGSLVASAGLGVWTLGGYKGFKVLAGGGTGQVRVIFKTWGRTQDIAIGLDRVFELLDLRPEVEEAQDARPLAPVREGIRFESVSFRYVPERAALHDLSFEARVGEVTALVGPTGSGKSTALALLLRLFEPDAGRISIDGVELGRLQLASLRSRVAVALQENVLFGASIRENIRYGRPGASDAEVRAAARVACADGFVEALPEGYETLLGERGTKLSTGQRQRISLARAVLKDPDVLVLDEPTAALDARTEIEVLGRLSEWGRRRAILLVTHRLSTIRRADRIVVLREGRLVESGSHESLMARGRGYRSLVEAEAPARGGQRS